MNFDYNEEQQLLADSVRRFVQKDYDFEARRKFVALDTETGEQTDVILHLRAKGMGRATADGDDDSGHD
jgi:alkylation response protein AidB-like acyl-CoA dehydrogenase